jgi:hypothetical protein
VWTIVNNPMSLFGAGDGDGVLVLGGIFSSPWRTDSLSRLGRRYQHVSAAAVAAQVVFAFLVGYATTIVAAPLLPLHRAPSSARPEEANDGGPFDAGSVVVDARILLAGIATVTVHAIAKLLAPHELAPRQYCRQRGAVEAVLASLPRTLRNAAGAAALGTVLSSSIIAIAGGNATIAAAPGNGPIQGLGWAWPGDFLALVLFNFGMVVYVLVLDEALKIALFDRCRAGAVATGDIDGSGQGPLDDLIEELTATADIGGRVGSRSDDETISPVAAVKLEILLTSLLYSPSLVRAVLAPTPSDSDVGAAAASSEPGRREREEDRRVAEAAQRLGHLLVHPRPVGSRPAEAPLEEDVMRTCVLKALADGVVTESWLGGSGSRLQWAVGDSPLRGMYPAYVFPLVRALCVHVQGMGDALLTCASPANRGTPFLGGSGASLQRWHLPPGLEFAVECSVQALCAIFAQHRDELAGFVSWKSALLSTFVPISLSSMFHLRRGLLAFATPPPIQFDGAPSLAGDARGDAIDQRLIESHLFQACDNGALSIVRSIGLPKGHQSLSRTSLRDDETAVWVNALLASQE